MFFIPNLIGALALLLEFVIIISFLHEPLGHQGQDGTTSHPTVWQTFRRWWNKKCAAAISSGGETEPLLTRTSSDQSNTPSTTQYNLSAFVFNNASRVIITFALFAFSGQAYFLLLLNIFSSAEPTGRGATPDQIGYATSAALVISIVFQSTCFGPLDGALGSITCYRLSLLILCIVCYTTPLAASLMGPDIIIWAGFGSMLTVKFTADFVAQSCSLILVQILSNSAH
jgi:hypothetical protein